MKEYEESGWEEQEPYESGRLFVRKPARVGDFVRMRILSTKPTTIYTCYLDDAGMILYPGEDLARSYRMPNGQALEDLDWNKTKSVVVWVYTDPKDLTRGAVQVWEPPKMTWNQLLELRGDPEYGAPIGYDVKWSCTQADPRRYSLTPYPPKELPAPLKTSIKENWIKLSEFYRIPTREALDRKFKQSSSRPGAGQSFSTREASEGDVLDDFAEDAFPAGVGV